jgi:hypothetical protein
VQSKKTEPLADSIGRACEHVAQRPAFSPTTLLISRLDSID